MALVVLLTASLASAVPEVASQSIVSIAQGTDITQSSTNDAAVEGNGAVYSGDILQVGSGTGTVAQTATNTADVTGDDASSAQGISQAGQGSTVTQVGANGVVVIGGNAVAGQVLTQSAAATGAVTQTGSSTAAVTGNGALVGQVAFTAGTGSSVTQHVTNVVGVTGDNPTSSQLIAGGAIASGAVNQVLTNSLLTNPGSLGGAAAQLIDVGAIGGTVSHITNNLVDTV